MADAGAPAHPGEVDHEVTNLRRERELDDSPVVANSAMNRERGLLGPNSYTRDLPFDVLGFLKERLRERGRAAWLDLCCGSGRALIEAGERLRDAPPGSVRLQGVDLVEMFLPVPPGSPVRLEAASLADWTTAERFDLVTCVHGLHYVCDKLALIGRAASWLEADGRFLAHLDPENVRLADGSPGGRPALQGLRGAGFVYEPRRHLLSCTGPRGLSPGFTYLGADDAAGPNYTGQAAVHSYYRFPPR